MNLNEVGFSAERLERISTMLHGYAARGQLPGILAEVSRGGQVVYRQKFGMADIEAAKPIEYDTIFRIASMTKPVVCAAIMMLCEDVAKLPLAFPPGTKWRYSMAIDVLGYLIEVISGMSLGEFLRKRVFEPLGMPDTGFYVPPEKAARVAAVYTHKDPAEPLVRMDIPVQTTPPSFESGGGGLCSTLHDYGRFAQMLVNGGELDGVRLLGPKTVELFTMNHTPLQALPYGFQENDLYHAGYGFSLGTRVLMDVSQTGLSGSVGEFGWDGAFSTYFWVDPQEELYGLMMLQHSPNAFFPIAQQFKQLTCQALVD